MSKLFDQLEDESEPTTGMEIGNAISAALQELGKSNADMAATITKAVIDALGQADAKQESMAKSMLDALHRVDSKQIVINDKPVTKWTFKVERDARGQMTQVTATAA